MKNHNACQRLAGIKGMPCLKRTTVFFLSVLGISAQAQDGNAGINDAITQLNGYFETGTTLMYTIGAVVGLIGAVKVYQKWNSGDQDTSRVAASWFGSCIFLVIVASVLRSFFL
jgi:hypothetical protein